MITEYRWRTLPYGQWIDRTGRTVLFNRRYKPIWERLADGTVRAADPGEWVDWIAQSWFYGERNLREEGEKSVCARMQNLLIEWFEQQSG